MTLDTAEDDVAQVVELEGLDQIVVGAFPQTAAHRLQVTQPGDHDDLDIVVQLLETMQELDTGRARHVDVG
jgi:hypothetical protein